jgi:hypothetical protein
MRRIIQSVLAFAQQIKKVSRELRMLTPKALTQTSLLNVVTTYIAMKCKI